MSFCPNGHSSDDPDFCDVCGHQMVAAPVSVPTAPPSSAATPAPVEPDAPDGDESCPVCGEPRSGRFCEGCSYDFVSGVGSVPATESGAATESTSDSGWRVVVSADHAYYERVRAEGEPGGDLIPFPDDYPERTIPLAGQRIQIGRRSRSRGLTPEIDLAGPPEDPGVSHRHAVLIAQPDGGWTVQDTDSTNGTTVNDNAEPIPPSTPIRLADGDRIHVGAWTTITLRAAADPREGSR